MTKKNDINLESETNHKKVIEVLKEEVIVSKEVIEKRRIKIQKTVDSEELEIAVPLVEENIKIEHIKFEKEVNELPKIRTEGNVTIIPVIKEVAVVVKKIMLVEEIHITRELKETIDHLDTTLREEKINIKENG